MKIWLQQLKRILTEAKRPCLIACILFTGIGLLTTCSNFSDKTPLRNWTEQEFQEAIYFSDPDENGIRLLHPNNGTIIALTTEQDDFPFYSPTEHLVYFLRTHTQLTSNQKETHKVSIMTKNVMTGKEKVKTSLLLYLPRKDKKDSLYFVEEGKKLVILPLRHPAIIIDTETGFALPQENPMKYFSGINSYSADNSMIYGIAKTETYVPYLKTKENLHPLEDTWCLFVWDTKNRIQPIETLVKKEVYENWYYGICYSQQNDILYFSKNNTLYQRVNRTTKKITRGIHPYCVKQNIHNQAENTFPFFRLYSFLEWSQNPLKMVFTENNHLAIYQNDTFHIVTNGEFLGGQTNSHDPTYLFDHLMYFGRLINPNESFILASTAEGEEINSEAIARNSMKPDLFKIFNLYPTPEDGTIDHTMLSLSQIYDLSVTLSENTPPAIIAHYTASNFQESEKLQVAGRAVQWMDVFDYDPSTQKFILANHHYGDLYQDLYQQLSSLYEFVRKSAEDNAPIMGEEDTRILKEKIRNLQYLLGISPI